MAQDPFEKKYLDALEQAATDVQKFKALYDTMASGDAWDAEDQAQVERALRQADLHYKEVQAEMEARMERYKKEVQGREQTLQARLELLARQDELLGRNPELANWLAKKQVDMRRQMEAARSEIFGD
jgi:hypothetical protein